MLSAYNYSFDLDDRQARVTRSDADDSNGPLRIGPFAFNVLTESKVVECFATVRHTSTFTLCVHMFKIVSVFM